MGPFTIKFIIDGAVARSWQSMEVPLVPQRGSRMLGRVETYRVAEIDYEYLLPEGCIIHVYLEKIE